MGYIIGEFSYRSTWRAVRGVVTNTNVTPVPLLITGDHNLELPASSYFLKTVAGTGFMRTPHNYFGGEIIFTQNTPPATDNLWLLNFSDPYPVDLVGRTVTTSTSSFSIVAGHFDPGGAAAGTGGTTPVLTVDWFTNVS